MIEPKKYDLILKGLKPEELFESKIYGWYLDSARIHAIINGLNTDMTFKRNDRINPMYPSEIAVFIRYDDWNPTVKETLDIIYKTAHGAIRSVVGTRNGVVPHGAKKMYDHIEIIPTERVTDWKIAEIAQKINQGELVKYLNEKDINIDVKDIEIDVSNLKIDVKYREIPEPMLAGIGFSGDAFKNALEDGTLKESQARPADDVAVLEHIVRILSKSY